MMSKIKKKRKPKSKNYFTQDTEEAIVKYNNEPNEVLRNIIYEKHIHYPFFKLTENIIHTFKFYHTEVENLEHLQHEIIVFLLTKIHLFNPSKSIESKINKLHLDINLEKPSIQFRDWFDGKYKIKTKDIKEYLDVIQCPNEIYEEASNLKAPKAYSYFGTIVKRWLIIYNQKNYKNKINQSNIKDVENDFIDDINFDDGHESNLDYFLDKYTSHVESNIEDFFPDKVDQKIAISVIELFKKKEHITIFNKKVLYVYIKEMVDVKTPKITRVVNQLKEIYQDHYVFYNEYGYVNI